MLSGVQIVCFAASYAIILALEASRLAFRAPVRQAIIVGFTGVALLLHSAYLVVRFREELAAGGSLAPLSSWYDWCLMAAWVIAAAYLGLMLRKPQNALGLFLLPLVLALIGAAAFFTDSTSSFPRSQAVSLWQIVHGLALLLGTVGVALGFATGMMHLIQSYRLKHKLPPRRGFKLPSLEWLQRFNRESLLISTVCLFVGLLSGIVLNSIRHLNDARAVPWTDPVVVSSGVLFLWLVAAMLFEFFYRPAREGKKVAYLTLCSFVFLALVLLFVLGGGHARSEAALQSTLSRAFPRSAAAGESP